MGACFLWGGEGLWGVDCGGMFPSGGLIWGFGGVSVGVASGSVSSGFPSVGDLGFPAGLLEGRLEFLRVSFWEELEGFLLRGAGPVPGRLDVTLGLQGFPFHFPSISLGFGVDLGAPGVALCPPSSPPASKEDEGAGAAGPMGGTDPAPHNSPSAETSQDFAFRHRGDERRPDLHVSQYTHPPGAGAPPQRRRGRGGRETLPLSGDDFGGSPLCPPHIWTQLGGTDTPGPPHFFSFCS